MYIESVPNRGSPPAILLRESFRADGRVRKRTLANLSAWPTALVEGFRLEQCAEELVERLVTRIETVKRAAEPDRGKVMRSRPRVVH
jgi:hypothetical protein